MDFKMLLTVFGSVFVAALGDKTQLATLVFASDKEVSKLTVFIGSASALVLTSAIGVLVGALLAQHINERYLHYAAGVGFIAIGLWTLLKA